MHRLLLCPPMEMQIDHVNGNKLDNRKSNLRTCTASENQHNQGLQINNTSGYKGVIWIVSRDLWRAQIKINSKQIYLGYFKNPNDAARAYNGAAIKLHGEFACLNKIP